MKITYTARKVNLRDNFKERAEKKLLKFEKLFSEDAAVNVVVTLEKNRQTVEITIRITVCISCREHYGRNERRSRQGC